VAVAESVEVVGLDGVGRTLDDDVAARPVLDLDDEGDAKGLYGLGDTVSRRGAFSNVVYQRERRRPARRFVCRRARASR
jgi:hypothetical protein